MAQQSSPVTFTLGAVAGILGGFALGIYFGKYVIQAIDTVWTALRNNGDADARRMKFELLLQ